MCSFADVNYNTYLNDDTDKPVFKKGAAFVFKYQAVTSESESKVRIFSPFPKMPEINLTAAYTIRDFKNHTTTLGGMVSVKACETNRMEKIFALLFEELETKLQMIESEIHGAATDKNDLLEIAKSFLPKTVNQQHVDGYRSKRAIGLIAAAAGAAGLVLGNPVKEAACSALSIFNLCSDNKALEADVANVMKQQNSIKMLCREYKQRMTATFSYWETR